MQSPPGQLGPGPMPADTGQQLQAPPAGTSRGAAVCSFPGHRPYFQGITPVSVFSFQLPQAKVWGMCRGSVKQSCCEMTLSDVLNCCMCEGRGRG